MLSGDYTVLLESGHMFEVWTDIVI